ncbi:brevican core protein-like [Pagrus major]|uniref:brevican core protein-like n=1 Tax=Pagrus major TaxID=143350 RepID=UPI003CC8699C
MYVAKAAASVATRDDVWQLQVNIPHSGPVSAPLGSSISIPCLVSLSSIPTSSSSSPVAPRVKWTVVSGGVETQILVARGQRVKVNEAYRDRAAWLNYTSSPDDLSLWLGDLRSSDSGHYRCEVQQGLEDASDLVELKVKGVVFHYRDALGRYAFTFPQAQRACEAIGAQIATPDQLLAAYYDGYEQCDAGWLADQSVRYPIQVPREGCYGDMDGQPGVRNYGTMDPDDLFDVYCYVEETEGEVIYDSVPQLLSFDEAQSYCRATGAELATTAQLYLAWSEGLDRCSPGWLSDGSVRYPIITPRERCGGPQPGVKTLYRFSNQTGFPEPSSLHDVYCFKDNRDTHTDSPMDYMATEPEHIKQDVVILMETDQELQLNQHAEQVELKAQRVVESFPLFSSPSTEENPTVISDTTESSLNTTLTLDFLQAHNETSSPTEMSSQNPTALMNSTISTTETYDSPQNTSSLLSVYNQTDSLHNLNFTFHESEPESTTEFPESTYEPQTHNQTVTDTNSEENTSERPKDSQEIQEINLNFNRSQANYTESDSNRTQEESFWEVTHDPMVQVKLEEAVVEDPVQMSLSTQASKEEEEEELVTQPAQTTKSSIKELTSVWAPLDGSGDISQETSNWALLSTTTGPQESLNDLEYNRNTSTAAPDSSSSTKPTAAATKMTTTTHWSRRTWSPPTTSAPKVFHKTAEPRQVTAFIPPVDQGLVDVEFSLTQPPTLLILPNERAAVGGTGKASAEACALMQFQQQKNRNWHCFVSDACVGEPCLNGGTCTDRDGEIKCLCLPTYGGDFCQTDVERCEPGWDKFQGFCYRHFGQRLSWEVAEQHCRMLGAHLVSIMTPEEQSYINNNYKEYQWTGLNDKTIEDDFRWSDGNPLLYENWYRGQPDSYFLSGEDCVVMVWHDDGRWSDVPCNYHLAYTCKKGTSSCGPPPKVRNASMFGKARQRYETNAVVRYHCAQGFQQRLNPLIRCLSGGRWERPQILCIPEAGGPTQHPEVTSLTNTNFAAMEDEFEATKETPQYWDIRQQIAAAAMEGSQSVLTHRPQFRLTGTCLLGGTMSELLKKLDELYGAILSYDLTLMSGGGGDVGGVADDKMRALPLNLNPVPSHRLISRWQPRALQYLPRPLPLLLTLSTVPVFVKLSSLTFRIPRLALCNLSSISPPPPSPPAQPFFTSGLGGSRRRPTGTRNTEC